MSDSDEVLVNLAAGIVSAFVSHNRVPTAELPALISSTYTALKNVSEPPLPAVEARPDPAVPVKKSITQDFIICLEDGLKFKSMKRHLRNSYDMTPDEYRVRWDLPADYPMVAPGYAEARSNLAKKLGLGQMHRKAGTTPGK